MTSDPSVRRLRRPVVCRQIAVEATIISYSATRMELRFDGEILPGPHRIVLRRMNADGKSYALARLKVEVVGQAIACQVLPSINLSRSVGGIAFLPASSLRT